MGATVTVDKRAYAFRSGEKIVYALFESTYEKNCYPHQSRWSCIAIGGIAQVLRRIYGSVHATIDGGLQGRNGCISPTNYLKGWMAELANPCAMPDQPIDLKYGTGFYDALQKEADESFGLKSTTQVRAALVAAGVNVAPIDLAISHSEKKEKLTISLHEYADFVVALAQNGVYPWRLISSMPGYVERDASLGYQSGNPKTYAMNHRYVRLLTNSHNALGSSLLLREDVRTPGVYIESAYSTDWLNSLAVAEEMANPGSVQKGLRIQIDAQKEALFASLNTIVTVSRPNGDDNRWSRENYVKFSRALGRTVAFCWAPLTIVTTLKECLMAGVIGELGYLSRYISHVQVDDSQLIPDVEMSAQMGSLKAEMLEVA